MPGASDTPRPGRPARPTGAAVRASDAEREATIDALRDAAAEGRLTFEELADRIEAAAAAVHRHDLARLTADLPGGAGSAWSADAGVAAPAGRGSVAARDRQTAVFGDVRRSGPWAVPERSRWASLFGDVVLDLREATVAHDRIEIDAGTVFGDVVLFVPEGVVVDVRVRAGTGGVHQRAGHDAPPGAPVVVLTGGTWFGEVRVLERRLRDRLAAFLRAR
jgi:hypothetical protein